MSNTLPALSERDERAYRANLGLYVAYSTLQSFQLWLPIWIVYLQQQRHLSLTQITLLDMPFFLTQVISEVPTGAIADRFGRKTSLLLGAAFATVGIGVFGIAGNYSVIVISYVFWGVGMTLQSGADQAFLYDTLKILGRETEYSRILGRATAVTIVASIVAGLLGAPLAAATTLATPVLVSAFIFAASAVVALTFKEPPPQEQRLSYVATIRTGLTEVGRRPVIRTVIIFGVASSLCFLLPQYFQQPYLKQHGVSTAALGLFLMPARAVSAMVSVGTHRIEARIGARSAIAIMPVLCLAVCAVLAGWGSLWAFALVPVAAGASTARSLLISNYINARIASDQRATILSINALATALVLAMCLPVFGYLADHYSLRFVFGVAAVVGTGLMPMLFILWRRAEAEEQLEALPA